MAGRRTAPRIRSYRHSPPMPPDDRWRRRTSSNGRRVRSSLFLSLDGLGCRLNVTSVCLLGDDDRQWRPDRRSSSTIRDPQIPAGGGLARGRYPASGVSRAARAYRSSGTSRAVPSRIDGPAGADAEIEGHALRDEDGADRRVRQRSLPFRSTRKLLAATRLGNSQGPALQRRLRRCGIAHLTVARDGIGFATLTCERGFRAAPLALCSGS